MNEREWLEYQATTASYLSPEERLASHAKHVTAPRRLVNFARADQILLAPTDWLIRGWLVRNTLAALVAPSGAGKSFLAIDWACRVATGCPWYSRDVKQGTVFYLAGEGRQGLRKRIAAWERHNAQPLGRAPLMVADGLPCLGDDATTGAVIEAMRESAEEMFFQTGSDPQLIVVDTVARAMAGADENSAKDMGAFVGALDWMRNEWGCAVLVLHHTGHNTPERGRGSSALYAALDSEFLIVPGEKLFQLKGSKEKDWQKPAPLSLSWADVEIEVPNDDPDGPTTLIENSRAIVDDIGSGEAMRREDLVDHLHGHNYTVRQIATQTGIPKSTVARMLKARGVPPAATDTS